MLKNPYLLSVWCLTFTFMIVASTLKTSFVFLIYNLNDNRRMHKHHWKTFLTCFPLFSYQTKLYTFTSTSESLVFFKQLGANRKQPTKQSPFCSLDLLTYLPVWNSVVKQVTIVAQPVHFSKKCLNGTFLNK